MKKLLLFFFCTQLAFAQTNIAVPNYSSVTNSFNAATGNIKFYLNGVSQSLTMGHGANGVCFFGNNLFVAYDDNNGSGNGIIWYKNVSFSTGTFSSDAPQILVNNKQTFQVAVDAAGNVYSANYDGTITKFTRNATAPFYSNANQTSVAFFNAGSYVLGGLYIDDATNTLWAASYSNHTMAVCKLNNFSALGIKNITISNNYLQAPEGITKDALGNIWVANNNNDYIVRINSASVSTIINELNLNNYTTKNLVGGTNANTFEVSVAGHQLGGIVYDNLYSSKIYVNDQVNGGNTTLYSFTPTNGTPVFSATTFTQVFPGNGQPAIIPCALLPTPANPTASGTTINSGQSATLTASNCAADQTYIWKNGASIVGTNASYTTPTLNASTTYTSHCVRAGTCESTGTNVTVTVTTASLSVSATPSTICEGTYSQLTATGCAGNVTWNTGQTSTTFFAYPTTTTTYTATCSTGGSSSTTVTVNPNPAPVITSSVPSILSDCGNTEVVYLHTNETTTLTATGCTGTITWDDYTTTSTGNSLLVTAPSLATENGMKYINVSCSHANGCLSYGFMTILNQFATDDNFSTTVNTPFTGNVITNDTETSVAWGAYGPTTTAHGTIVWTMGTPRPTGQFTYTPNADFEGTDTFTYFVSDDLTCSKRATVTITVGSPCVSSIAINTANYPNYTANQVVQASEFITTTSPPNIIISTSNSNKLTYQAGKSVTLNPGFSVNNGAIFNAKIGNCASAVVHQTMYVQGRHLYNANGQQIILRGVNYPVLDDWGFPAADLITEIEKSGANTVRLQWYKNYGNNARPTYTDTHLDNLLTKCKNNQMIPILELHDVTCQSDANLVNTQLIPWWTNPARVTMLNQHKKYLIINLANELGQYRWQGYSTAALNNFKNAYKTAITSIRNAGLLMPIMIDGSDCGSDIKIFLDAGQELIDHDPEHNLIFSSHAYWAAYNNGNTDLTNAINANLPIVFGEVANKQDETVNVGTEQNPNWQNSYCHYNIDGTVDPPNNPTNGFQYQNLLTTLKNQNVGWIAWAWVRDGCSYRNMTNNSQNPPYGQYNSLTTFGNNVVNNAVYGIKNTAVRSNAF